MAELPYVTRCTGVVLENSPISERQAGLLQKHMLRVAMGVGKDKKQDSTNVPGGEDRREGEGRYERKRKVEEHATVTDDHAGSLVDGGLVSGGSAPSSSSAPANGREGLSDRYACGKKRIKRDPDQAHDLTSELPDHIGSGYRTFSV